MTANHSRPLVSDGDEIIQPGGRTPLIAVELTPLVPLRKSTAIDISIRSPPTSDSRITTGNNIMLRSRNASECDQLYAMINQSRINNPTYLALQNARGPYGHTSWAEAMDRRNEARTSAAASGGGMFGGSLGRRSSYRKSSTRAASISAATESSVGTMGTAMRSALSRFSFGKGGMFGVRNSLVPLYVTEELGKSVAWAGAGLLAGSLAQAVGLLRAGRLPARGFVQQEQVALEDFLATRVGPCYAGLGDAAQVAPPAGPGRARSPATIVQHAWPSVARHRTRKELQP